MSEKTYQVIVFGKAGCDKCKKLNSRLDKLLKGKKWAQFEKVYCDLESEQGLVTFCSAECINPQRIPAMLVKRKNAATGAFEPMDNPAQGASDPVCKNSSLYTYLGLQTDYSETGKGVITPKMIEAVLSRALT